MARNGFTLIELMIVIAIIAIIAAIAIPGILIATRTANENNASSSLKQMGNTEVMFKSGDADQNGINDYWTADVRGLYQIIAGGPTGALKMTEFSIQLADGAPKPGTDYVNPATTVSAPKAGYWFMAHVNFENPSGTANPYGRRNLDRYSFLVVPDSYGSSGKLVFILNEANTMYKRDGINQANYIATQPVTGVADPGGALQPLYQTYPFSINAGPTAVATGPWSKMD